MATERKRGCGYRKRGGTYLVSDGAGFPCGRFPLGLIPCPLCDHRPAFTRGVQRITPRNILHASEVCAFGDESRCANCPLNKAMTSETAGLMWVGDKFYTPETFAAEAADMGVSKRISSVPKWLEVGKTWVFLAHEKAIQNPCEPCRGTGTIIPADREDADGVHQPEPCEPCDGEGKLYTPAVFYAFRVARVERLIPASMPALDREKLYGQGLTLVEVPDDDPDHQSGRQVQDEE